MDEHKTTYSHEQWKRIQEIASQENVSTLFFPEGSKLDIDESGNITLSFPDFESEKAFYDGNLWLDVFTREIDEDLQ